MDKADAKRGGDSNTILLIKSSILWYPIMGIMTRRGRAGEKKEDEDEPSAASVFC